MAKKKVRSVGVTFPLSRKCKNGVWQASLSNLHQSGMTQPPTQSDTVTEDMLNTRCQKLYGMAWQDVHDSVREFRVGLARKHVIAKQAAAISRNCHSAHFTGSHPNLTSSAKSMIITTSIKYAKLLERFKHYGVTEEDAPLIKYIGGDTGSHDNYFWLLQSRDDTLLRPARIDFCVCNHYILRQMYVQHTQTNQIFVLGSCCVKMFLSEDNAGRTCHVCAQPHRNFSANLCNDCKKSYCRICHKPTLPKLDRCVDCEGVKFSWKRKRE